MWGNVRPHDSVIDATTQIMQYIVIKYKTEKEKKKRGIKRELQSWQQFKLSCNCNVNLGTPRHEGARTRSIHEQNNQQYLLTNAEITNFSYF